MPNANGGVVTSELVMKTSSFIADFDGAMNHVQKKAAQMSNVANPLAKSFQYSAKAAQESFKAMENSVNGVNNALSRSEAAIQRMLAQTKYVPKAAQDMYNFGYQAQAGFRNLVGQMDSLQGSYIKNYDAIQRLGNASTAMGGIFKNSLDVANKAESAISNMLQAPQKYVPTAAAAMNNFNYQAQTGFKNLIGQADAFQKSYIKNYHAVDNFNTQAQVGFKNLMNQADAFQKSYINSYKAVENFGYQAQAGFANLMRQIDSYGNGMARSTEANGSRMVNTWNAVMARMQTSSSAGVRSIGNSLSVINNSRFDKLATNFEATIRQMGNIAQAGAKNIKNSLTQGLGASDYMATIFGGVVAGNLSNYAQTLAGTKAMLGIKYDPATAAQYYNQEQQYTLKSSTPDAQIQNLLKYVLGTKGLQANQTYAALNAIDAASTTPDPIQRLERLRNYGQYLTGASNIKQLFRGDVTDEQMDILMKGDATPGGRIAAMEEVARQQGTLTKFGESLSTITLETLPKYDKATQDAVLGQASFNTLMAASDTLMRGMSAGFTAIVVAVAPLAQWFNSLDSGTQILIGEFVLFVGGALVLASTLGILISVLSPVFGLISFVSAATVSLAFGFSMNTAEAMGLAGSLDYAALSFVAYVTGTDAATVANAGLTSSLYAAATGFLTMEVAGAPIWAIIIAVVALGAAIYGLGAYMGWWTDSASMGAAVMAGLQQQWLLLVDGAEQLTWALAPLAQIWTIITSAFYDSQGNWLGLFQGLLNIDWNSIFSVIQQTLTNLGTLMVHWILGGISGADGSYGIWAALFGWTYGDGSQEQGIITNIYNFITSIDWGSITLSAITTVAQTIANYNLMTLLITAIFGTEAGNAYSAQLMQGFYAIINGLTWIAGAIGNTVSFFSPAFNTIYNIFAGFYTGATIIWNALLIILTGVWNAIVAAGTSLWTSLQGIINPLINIFQILWNAVSVIWANIANAWTLFTGAFFDSEGKWLGIIPGIANVFGLLWNWLANMDWGAVGSAILSGLMAIAGNLGSAFLSLFMAIPNALGSAASSIGTSIYNWFVSTDWIGLFTQLGQFLWSLNPVVIIWNAIFGTGGSGNGQSGTGGQGGSGGNSVASNIQNSFMGVDWVGLFTQIGQFIASYNPLTLIVMALFGTDAGTQFSNAIMNVFSSVGNIFSLIGQFLFGGGAQQTGADISNWITGLAAQIPGAIAGLVSSIAGWIAAAVPNFLNILFTLIGHYNPVTLITVLIFGPEAGQEVQNQTVQFLWGLVNNFVNGLTVLYNTIVLIGTTIYNFFSWLWDTIYTNAVTIWNIYYTTVIAIWTGVYNFFSWLWNAIYTDAMLIWTIIYTTLTTIWNTIYTSALFIWNTLYFYIMQIWNFIYTNALIIWGGIYGFFTGIWNGIYGGAVWVWNNVFLVIYSNLLHIWSIAVGIGTAIYSAIIGAFNNIYGHVHPIFVNIQNAFNAMRDGLVNAAIHIRDAVWNPINTLYQHLLGFWNWITHPLSGPSNTSGPRPSSGPRPGVAGPRPYSGSSGSYSGGFFGGVMDAAFNKTEAMSGYSPRGYAGGYAGGYYSGPGELGDGNYPSECDINKPCYAGPYDFGQTWIDEAIKTVKNWSMNINGQQFSLNSLAQGGNLALFDNIARRLIAPTHYDYYYNGRYSDKEALQRRAFNCFDGAEILIHLARAMNLDASMGFTTWGNDGHAYAKILGRIYDTTAFQHGYGWRAPMVNYSGPSYSGYGGYYMGGGSKEVNIYLTFEREVYDPRMLQQIVREGIKQGIEANNEGEYNIINQNIRY